MEEEQMNEDLPEAYDMNTFDPVLPRLHSYLGMDLEVLDGNKCLQNKLQLSLGVLVLPNVVVLPGETLPLAVDRMDVVRMMRDCIEGDGIFALPVITDETSMKYKVGTTMEIVEYHIKNDTSLIRIKARARQRFSLVNVQGSNRALVRIEPEVVLPPVLDDVRLQSLRRIRTSQPRRCRIRDAVLTRWPWFVYEQYDVNLLQQKLKSKLKKMSNPKMKLNIPDDPTEMSFWVGQNIPLLVQHQIMLLKLNSPIQRIRLELSAMKLFVQFYECKSCHEKVGCSQNHYSMSTDGSHGTYVNPGGFIHQIITLTKVSRFVTSEPSSTVFSWFPGYAWQIGTCESCNEHLGWKFTAKMDRLQPKCFYALARNSLRITERPRAMGYPANAEPLVF